MNAAPEPSDSPRAIPGEPAITAAADRARALLREEIDRLRVEVEKTVSEQGGVEDSQLRRELDDLREETRLYVKKRVRKSEDKAERSARRIEKRIHKLERRIDEVEEGRARAEWRIHADMAAMLDGHLAAVRAIADRLDGVVKPD